MECGNYRWVASVMNQVIFADPANKQARELGADALEQLGYQAEAATWRNAYLMGAMELRNGVTRLPPGALARDMIKGGSHRRHLRPVGGAPQSRQGRGE